MAKQRRSLTKLANVPAAGNKTSASEEHISQVSSLSQDAESEIDSGLDVAFLDNVAHQLIAPLQTVQAHCENIYEGYLSDEESKKRLKEVIGHLRMAIQLAQRVRFLYELVSDEGDHKQRPTEVVPFSSVVTQFIDGYNNYLLMFRERGVQCDIDADSMNELPSVKNWSLASQQVIMNLFDNAAKYCRGGSTVRIAGKKGRGIVQAHFWTRSTEIPESDKERIFDKGFRSAAVRTRAAAGTGLGLWISRQLMRAMDGDIFCTPGKSGGDNRFTIVWKAAK